MSDTHRRVMNLVARGRLTGTDDTDGLQTADLALLHDEAKAKVERFQQYGFTAHPPVGSEAVVLFIGGGRDHGVAIAIDNRASRMPGQAVGEVAMYSDEGDFIVLKRGNGIDVTTHTLTITADTEVIIKAPKITITGTINLTGDLHCSGTITADTVNAPNGHVGALREDEP